MRTEKVHTLVLGAGPAGLAAGYTLAKAGLRPVILDRDSVPGGLMRSIRHGSFVVDVGRKELYNRLAKVDDFWENLIGSDYRTYPHRGGYLYQGRIFEMSPAFRGFRRGMPWSVLFGCVGSFLLSRLNVFAAKPANVEEYFYRKRGRILTQIASQGFQEKLTGERWANIALPDGFADGDGDALLPTLRAAATRALSSREVNTFKGVWRHPAKGTGQICDALAEGIVASGGSFAYGAKLLGARASADRIEAVSAEVASENICYHPEFVVSSIPLDALLKLIGRQVSPAYTAAVGGSSRRRTVVLVYLFLDRPVTFPHAWLQVTCTRTRIGRITNYSGFEADMVPNGMGCLCCEYYCYGADPLLELDDNALVRQTAEYCVSAGLIQAGSGMEDLVLRLPGADASQNRHNWITSMRLGLLEEIKPIQNLFHAGRTDLDIATLAGIESAEAILSGERATFDRHFDPTEIGIRSVRKALEFKMPAAARAS